LAFHGAKSVDDGRVNLGGSGVGDESGARWEKEFKPDAIESLFWTILEGLPGEIPAPAALREAFQGFTSFAKRVHKRLREPARLFPIYDDTAAMLRTAIDEGGNPERIVQIAALDPFLTIDLLYLANSLRTEPKELIGTAREAVRVVGTRAIQRFIGLLADVGSPKVPSEEKMERVVRRSALSTAVAGSHLAEDLGLEKEDAYTLGLLEPLGSYELLKLLISVAFPPGPIRAGALSRFRAAAGRVLARKLNLPHSVEDVLGSSGQVTSRSPAAERLIFLAKQAAPSEQIGQEWTSDDPRLTDQVVALTARSERIDGISRDTAMLREILQL
ncbi:MAG: HDOD domain-containing protein, partial [Thermoanaerobaculia bacterium]